MPIDHAAESCSSPKPTQTSPAHGANQNKPIKAD